VIKINCRGHNVLQTSLVEAKYYIWLYRNKMKKFKFENKLNLCYKGFKKNLAYSNLVH